MTNQDGARMWALEALRRREELTRAGREPPQWGGRFSLFGGGRIFGELYVPSADPAAIDMVVRRIAPQVDAALDATCREAHEVPGLLDAISATLTQLVAADLAPLGGGYVYVLGLSGGEIPAGTVRKLTPPAEAAPAPGGPAAAGGAAAAAPPMATIDFGGTVDVVLASGARLCVTVKGTWRGRVPPEQQGWVQAKLLDVAREMFAGLPDPGAFKTQGRQLPGEFQQRVEQALSAAGLRGEIGDVGFRPQEPPAGVPAPAPAAPGPGAGAALPDLAVEQYASLCVERNLSPGAEAGIAQRYHVPSPEALRALDALWAQRFQADGDLYRRFQQGYAHYEAWLRSQR